MFPTLPIPQIPQIPQVPPAPSSTSSIKLSELTANLISNTGSAPADSDIQACSELPLDLEKLQTIIGLLMQDKELLSFLIYPHTSKSFSASDGVAGFGIKCEDAPDNRRDLYLVYYARRDGRPMLLQERLISVSQLISCKVQGQNDCLVRADLHNMNLSDIHIHNGDLCKTNLRKTNLSNSIFEYVNLRESDLRRSSFENAILNQVRIEDAQIDEHTNFTNTKIILSFPEQLTSLKLFRLLATINRINNDYQALKIELIHQIIDRLKNEIFTDAREVFLNLIYFLEDPIYLQDKKITSFIAERFSKLNANPQPLIPVELFQFLATVNKFNDAYYVLKIKLVHQIIDSLKNVTNEHFSDVRKVFSNLIHVLKGPVYFKEEKIISFIAERFFKLNASPQRLVSSELYRFLIRIRRIHPVYKTLKIKLVHQIIDSLKSGANQSFFNGLEVFSKLIQLLKDPIYLQDKKITSFITEKFLNLEGHIPESKDLLRLLEVIRNSDQEIQQKIISKSTGFVIQLMMLCSELCEDGENQIDIPMLHQLIDCLNDADISDSDNKLVMFLLNHPAYVDDSKIMLFLASQLVTREHLPHPGSDSLFFRKVMDCLSQEKFMSDCAPLTQLMALYAQTYSEIIPELSINIMFHAIEMFQVDNFSSCRNVLWDTLLTSPVYLQNAGIFKLIISKFINTNIVTLNGSGFQSEEELKLQFLLNVIHGLTLEDQKKFMLHNNHFFIRFVQWCTREGTPPKIVHQVKTLYATYLALPELKGVASDKLLSFIFLKSLPP